MDDILTEPHDGWRKLILNQPARLNAVNSGMLTRLLAAIDAAEADVACRAVVLTGAGRGFCAGQELGPDVTPGPDGPPICGRWRIPSTMRLSGGCAGLGYRSFAP